MNSVLAHSDVVPIMIFGTFELFLLLVVFIIYLTKKSTASSFLLAVLSIIGILLSISTNMVGQDLINWIFRSLSIPYIIILTFHFRSEKTKKKT